MCGVSLGRHSNRGWRSGERTSLRSNSFSTRIDRRLPLSVNARYRYRCCCCRKNSQLFSSLRGAHTPTPQVNEQIEAKLSRQIESVVTMDPIALCVIHGRAAWYFYLLWEVKFPRLVKLLFYFSTSLLVSDDIKETKTMLYFGIFNATIISKIIHDGTGEEEIVRGGLSGRNAFSLRWCLFKSCAFSECETFVRVQYPTSMVKQL